MPNHSCASAQHCGKQPSSAQCCRVDSPEYLQPGVLFDVSPNPAPPMMQLVHARRVERAGDVKWWPLYDSSPPGQPPRDVLKLFKKLLI
jgi:hypothetical protein